MIQIYTFFRIHSYTGIQRRRHAVRLAFVPGRKFLFFFFKLSRPLSNNSFAQQNNTSSTNFFFFFSQSNQFRGGRIIISAMNYNTHFECEIHVHTTTYSYIVIIYTSFEIINGSRTSDRSATVSPRGADWRRLIFRAVKFSLKQPNINNNNNIRNTIFICTFPYDRFQLHQISFLPQSAYIHNEHHL